MAMSDQMIIQGLHNLSIKLVDDMRFAEADIVDQAIARIMEIPKAVQAAHPSAWESEFKAVVDAIWQRKVDGNGI